MKKIIKTSLFTSFFEKHNEINLLKEENLYFIDSFYNIRTPITSIQTPLKSIYDGDCPAIIKNELGSVLRNIDCLNEHLTGLMNIKTLLTKSGDMNIAECELDTLLKDRIKSLQEYATAKKIKIKSEKDFKYASVRIDQCRISFIINKFIKSMIDGVEPENTIYISVSLNEEFWEIKITYPRKKQIFRPPVKPEVELNKSLVFTELMKKCNGKVLLNNSDSSVSLLFPVKGIYEGATERTKLIIEEKPDEIGIDTVLHKTSHTRSSGKPIIILADSNQDFRSYLESCLSEEYEVKSFDDGTDVLKYIKEEEHPDLIVSDAILREMGGIELSSRLKTSVETSMIPIILYGSPIDAEQRYKREASLADTYIKTPFHIEDLKIEMSVLIRTCRLQRKAFLLRLFGEKFLEATREELREKDKFFNDVKNFIIENIDNEKLRIEDIAANMCICTTTFRNKWSKLTGHSPKRFLLNIRLEKGRELLESGKYSVYEIPERIGMKDINNFRQLYKHQFKMTPSESIKKEE